MNQANSVEQFLKIVEKRFGTYEEKYFRGQLEKHPTIQPSICRDEGYKSSESQMYSETLMQRAEDFAEITSPFEKLSKMQHYGIPTRLIDVTVNPLVALYFAVEDTDCTSHGNVLIYIREGLDFASNHIRILSLLATINNPTLESLATRFNEEYGYSISNSDLLKYASEPSFVRHCDELKKSNNRLFEQKGAFFLCSNTLIDGVISGELKSLDSIPPSMVIRIPYEYKSHIKAELNEKHNINTAIIYPELPSFSMYLKEKYKQKNNISFDGKYEIVDNRQTAIPKRRWTDFFVVLKNDSENKGCGRKCKECQSKQLSISDIKGIVVEIINRHQNTNEVIFIFVASSNDDYLTNNWIIRAQWVNPHLPKTLKPMSLKGEEINGITWNENGEYSVRSDVHNNYLIESEVNLFVCHFKSYEIFKNVYQKMKQAYENMTFDEFLQVAKEHEDTIAKCYKDFGDFGISRTKEFNDFLENFIIVSMQANNWKIYRMNGRTTLQNLKQNIDYDVKDIDKHLDIIEKGLPEWRKRIGVTDVDIEKINFSGRKKSQYIYKQTIPICENAIDVYFKESTTVFPDRKIKVNGVTNLFDHASLMLSIKGENNYNVSGKTLVTDGKFEFEIFSKNGSGLDVGEYDAKITLSLSGTQPQDFVKLAGIEYENLTGKYVKRDRIAPIIEYQFNFNVVE